MIARAVLVRLPAALTPRGGGRSVPRLAAAGTWFDLEPLFSAPAPTARTPLDRYEWLLATPVGLPDTADAWALAHAVREGMLRTARAPGAAPIYTEPDFEQQWLYENPRRRIEVPGRAAEELCVFNDQVTALPHVPGRFAWHLDEDFSELAAARALAEQVEPVRPIRIAHLDTGYDETHATLPAQLRVDLARNMLDDQPADDARDPGRRGLLKHPGHGTGTLGILAGSRYTTHGAGYTFDGLLGGAPHAEIVPVRVGSSVVQFRTSSIARGIAYAATLGEGRSGAVDVVSLSMGGIASAAWADAVNLAYDNGVVIVAAAGNNYSTGSLALPTHFIVYPARFRRATAVCGVMADGRPYFDLPAGTMQGNWGPDSKMTTAVSAFTPNMPWAEIECPSLVDMDGSGTSAATPQVAAAAALYLRRHSAELMDAARYPAPWMRVEAARHALFSTAGRPSGTDRRKLGHGSLRAAHAVAAAPPDPLRLERTELDSAFFPFLHVLTGRDAAESGMLALEATQLASADAGMRAEPGRFERVVPDPDLPAETIPRIQIRQFLELLLDDPRPSPPLRRRAGEIHRELVSTP